MAKTLQQSSFRVATDDSNDMAGKKKLSHEKQL
jgi:hypothetical protein